MKKSLEMLRRERPSTLRTSPDLSVCPTCNGTGWRSYKKCVPEYGDKEAVFAELCPTCNGGLAERAEDARKRSNIPCVFYDKRYSSFDWSIYKDQAGETINLSKIQKVVEAFIKNYHEWKMNGEGLYVSSHTKGSGKTFLVSCIGNELMSLYGIRVKFVNANQLIEISQSGDNAIQKLCECEVLVLDDIGEKKNGYDWMNSILYRITDERMVNRLVTLYTSNDTVEELSLDERITERIIKTAVSIRLPEYNVRSREAYSQKLQFLKDQGLIERSKE